MPRRTHAILAVIGVGLALASGCSLELFAPASELGDEPQMLTIIADPPEANPGDVVTLEAVVHWPGDDWEAHWLVCIPQELAATADCVGDNFPADGQVPDCLLAPEAALCRLPSGPIAQVLVPPFIQLPPDVSFPVFVELLVARSSVGWDGCWTAVADSDPSPDCLLGLKTVWLSSEPAPNRNPAPLALLVDGVTHDASAPMVIGADASDLADVRLELDLVVDASSVDDFAQDEDNPDEVALTVDWFVTCGGVSKVQGDNAIFSDEPDPGDVNCTSSADATGLPVCEAAQANWRPREPGTCVVHAVMRDGFGGIGYLTRVFEVRGTQAPDADRTVQACDCRSGADGLPGGLLLVLLVGWLLRRRSRRGG